MSFERTARLSYAIVLVVIALGMAIAVRRVGSVTDDQVARIRVEEYEVTLIERLRWNTELITSDGRGYLISGEPDLLARVRATEASFDENVRMLRQSMSGTSGDDLVTDVERATKDFRNAQEDLFAARQRPEETGALIRRFETELRPRHHKIETSLDRLVADREAALAGFYWSAEAERQRWTMWLYGSLGALVLIGLGVAWYFARRLGRAYGLERAALATARKAIAARDELMGIVAHDLRNPLGAITMKAGLMKMMAESEKVRQDVESIENIAMRMDYLIKTMLDVATIEAGRFSLVLGPCDVDDLLRETHELFADLSAAKQIRLERDVKDSRLQIEADRERLLEVLSNLLGNALKFTPAGGSVTISTERQADGAVRFAVSDTGPGISGADSPHIFDRFWKRPTSGKKGTGLGLFIAKGIVEAHGGRIWVESQPGRGATFYFTVPMVIAERAESSLPSPLATGGEPAPT